MPPDQSYTISSSTTAGITGSLQPYTWAATSVSDYSNALQDYNRTLQDYAANFADINISSPGISISNNLETRVEEIVEQKLAKIFGKRAYMLGLIKLKDTGDYDGD